MAVPETKLLLYLERRCHTLKAEHKTDFEILQQLEACCIPWGKKLVRAVSKESIRTCLLFPRRNPK